MALTVFLRHSGFVVKKTMAKKNSSATNFDNRNDSSDIDFEQAVLEAQKIVRELESGELGLAESLKHYEVGIKRLNRCHTLLEEAERKVNVLTGFDVDGNPVTELFEDTSDHNGAPNQAGRRVAQKRTASKKNADDDVDEDDSELGLF